MYCKEKCRPIRADIILTAGGGLQSLNEHNSTKTATSSDELTCCNACHGTSTLDSNTAKQPHISQAVKKNDACLLFYMCFTKTP